MERHHQDNTGNSLLRYLAYKLSIASEAYILRIALANLLADAPDPNPTFQKNVKKDGYF